MRTAVPAVGEDGRAAGPGSVGARATPSVQRGFFMMTHIRPLAAKGLGQECLSQPVGAERDLRAGAGCSVLCAFREPGEENSGTLVTRAGAL